MRVHFLYKIVYHTPEQKDILLFILFFKENVMMH